MKYSTPSLKILVGYAVLLIIFGVCGTVTMLQKKTKEVVDVSRQSVPFISLPLPSRSVNYLRSQASKPPNTSFELSQQLQFPESDLSPLVIQGFLSYLINPPQAETAMDPAAEYFNNVISLLLLQAKPVTELSVSLLNIVKNSTHTLLIRDYALQHFFHCWIRESNVETRLALEQSLRLHAQDPKSPLQGVALLTSARLIQQSKPMKGPNGEKLTPIGGTQFPNPLSISKPTLFTDIELVELAMRITTESAAAPTARACAFNVLLNMEVRRAIEPSRQILRIDTTPDIVRCSALAVIGAFGDLTADRSYLDAIPIQPVDVRQAANSALNQLIKYSSSKN
jgi:hypothetical protein